MNWILPKPSSISRSRDNPAADRETRPASNWRWSAGTTSTSSRGAFEEVLQLRRQQLATAEQLRALRPGAGLLGVVRDVDHAGPV